MVERETIFYDIPVIWRENAKKGLCPVCGKHKAEFDKFMRVYCSKACQKQYNDKIYTWTTLREEIIKKHGEICDNCGITPEIQKQKREKEMQIKLKEWAKYHKAEIELRRKEMLDQVEKIYSEAMDDDYVTKRAAPYEITKHEWDVSSKFEVDHKKAIVNGGDMWNRDNLQVLCKDCHSKKTALDIKEKKKLQGNNTNLPLFKKTS